MTLYNKEDANGDPKWIHFHWTAQTHWVEKCLDLTENPAVHKDSLSSENAEKKRGRERKATTGESSKNKKSWW